MLRGCGAFRPIDPARRDWGPIARRPDSRAALQPLREVGLRFSTS